MSFAAGEGGGSNGIRSPGAPREPVRVCVITAAYPAPSEPTRAIFIENLCRALAGLSSEGRRFEVSVVAPRIRPEDPAREVRAGIPVRRFRYPSGGRRLKEAQRVPWLALSAYLASGFAAALAEVRRTRPAVIHCHWVLPAGLIGSLVQAVTGIPQVVHAHGSDIHRYALGSRARRAIARWVLGRGARVLAVSDALSRALSSDLGVGAGRLRLLPMGVDQAVFQPGDRPRARQALGLDGRRFELLFAGDLMPEKGVGALAQVILSGPPRPELLLNVAGDGPERPLLESFARRAPDRLRLLGRLPPERLVMWYRAADLLVLPSQSEGAPVSVMEALSSGLPVVATAVGGVPELVRPGMEGWLAPPGSPPEEFLALVREALKSPQEIERMRAGLLARGEDLSAARRARELGRILEEVVSNEGRPGD